MKKVRVQSFEVGSYGNDLWYNQRENLIVVKKIIHIIAIIFGEIKKPNLPIQASHGENDGRGLKELDGKEGQKDLTTTE